MLDHGRHGVLGSGAGPPVATYEVGEPGPPLHDDRMVEFERFALLRHDRFGVSGLTEFGERVDRAPYEPERDERRDDHNGNRAEDAAREVSQQWSLGRSGALIGSGVAPCGVDASA